MKKSALIFLFICTLVSVAALLYLRPQLTLLVFKITKIECKNQYGACQEEDLKKLEFLKDTNLLSVSEKQIQEKIQKDFRNQNAYIQKIFPGKIKVTIQKRKVYAGVVKENQKEIFLLSKDGMAIMLVDQTPLPVLLIDLNEKNLAVGERAPKNIIKAIKLIYLLKKAQDVNAGFLSGETIIVVLKNSTKVFFTLGKEPEVSAGALQLILANRTISGENNKKLPQEIDLRYSNAVVRY